MNKAQVLSLQSYKLSAVFTIPINNDIKADSKNSTQH